MTFVSCHYKPPFPPPPPPPPLLSSMAGIRLDAKFGKTEGEVDTVSPLSKGLALKICRPLPPSEATAAVTVTQSNAILRTLAGAKPDSLLYGKTDFESAQVGSVLFVFFHASESIIGSDLTVYW